MSCKGKKEKNLFGRLTCSNFVCKMKGRISLNNKMTKPLISILMAVYEPQIDWFREQLISLNKQTYPNLKLFVRDDCSKNITLADITAIVKESITAFPFTINRNETNLGSNRTFEIMTTEADGEYFAYCDQDDIWIPEKMTVLQKKLEEEKAELVCSDMYIIDEKGKQIADSMTKLRRRHVFRSGIGLTDTLWYSNFSSGCAMLVKANNAKEAIPFNPYMYYDHYITLYCANLGKIVSIKQPLIYHREHDHNQSSTLKGVYDKKSYKKIRIDKKAQYVFWLNDNFKCDEKTKDIIATGSAWMKARQLYAEGDRSQWKTIWKYRYLGPLSTWLELLMPIIPKPIFQLILYCSKKNLF